MWDWQAGVKRGPWPALDPRTCADLEDACGGRDVLLVDQRWDELRPVEPHHGLLVIAVGPKGVEASVRTRCYICVVAEETTTKPIAGVDRMRADYARRVRGQVPDYVIQARIVNVVAERVAGDSSHRWWRSGGTNLPW